MFNLDLYPTPPGPKPPMTNADRIRAMSDEELEAMLAGIMLGMQEMNSKNKWWREGETALLEVALGWLRKPAKAASEVPIRPTEDKQDENEIAKVCFNCKHHKLVDGSFEGGVVKCMKKGTYHYLEESGCDEGGVVMCTENGVYHHLEESGCGDFVSRFDEEDAR